MYISRRQFMKYCAVAAGALGLTATDLMKLENALAITPGGLPLNWIAGQACTGCTTSLANAIQIASLQDATLGYPNTVANLGAPATLDIRVLETLMGAEGDNVPAQVYTSGLFALVVEGAIPAQAPGNVGNRAGYCTIGNYSALGVSGPDSDVGDVVAALGNHTNCIAILAIGACASYGGVPGANGNLTGAMGVLDYLPGQKAKTICLPGCPPNPEWLVGAIVDILLFWAGLSTQLVPTLDNTNRPTKYYPRRVCNMCYRYPQASTHQISPLRGDELGDTTKNQCSGTLNHGDSATAYCLRAAGCRGQRTQANCGVFKWNSPGPPTLAPYAGNGMVAPGVPGVNWCVGAGAGCQGCVNKGFPDAYSPFWTLK